MNSKISMSTLDKLSQIKSRALKEKKRIVLVSGCFDLLHIGHLNFLKEAKSRGDILVVGILSDKFVKQRKGETRPIFNERERLEMVENLRVVDHTFILERNILEQFMQVLRPNLYVVGGDREKKNLPEKLILEKYKIPFEFTQKYGDQSTSSLLERIDKLKES